MSPWCGSKEACAPNDLESDMPAPVLTNEKEKSMTVMIGVDPHKGSHTAVALDDSEQPLGELRVRSAANQVERLLEWAAPLTERTAGSHPEHRLFGQATPGPATTLRPTGNRARSPRPKTPSNGVRKAS